MNHLDTNINNYSNEEILRLFKINEENCYLDTLFVTVIEALDQINESPPLANEKKNIMLFFRQCFYKICSYYRMNAYWDISGVSLPSVDKNAADILTATLSAAQLTYNFQSRLDTIMGFYQDVELIDSWTVALSAVASATNNTLAQHARSIGNLGNSTVFASGDKVMAMTPFPYQIDITNNSGQVINIVPSTSIYGVVVQL
jgi:hypothetical protein